MRVSDYLKIVEESKKSPARTPDEPTEAATKATEATKAPRPDPAAEKTRRDKSDISDKRGGRGSPNFTPLTVGEVLAEINCPGSGPAKNAELYRRGELSEKSAVEYVTCAILQRRQESFRVWKHHAPAVRKALALCIHELPPKECKACNGHAKRLIEDAKAGPA